jgi:hypothetical protein
MKQSLKADACRLTMVLPSIDIFVSENFLMGYHMVFDRESLRFGWSRSNCKYFSQFKKFKLLSFPNLKLITSAYLVWILCIELVISAALPFARDEKRIVHGKKGGGIIAFHVNPFFL